MSDFLHVQWFKFFERKVKERFNIKTGAVEGYQRDISPIIYASLISKAPSIAKKVVLESEDFLSLSAGQKEKWFKLKNKIENGVDVSSHLSKRSSDFLNVDYLLFTCAIWHMHLEPTAKGGKGDDLVFGIFSEEKFYAICLGNHHDIFEPDKLISIAEKSWPGELFRFVEDQNSNLTIKYDRRMAMDGRQQFNLISPVSIPGLGKLDGHQYTNLISFTLNNITYERLSFKIYCAYINEINFLEELDARLVRDYETNKFTLTIFDNGYRIDFLSKNKAPVFEKYPDGLICSKFLYL